ncbi:MAG: hypothetical protein JRN67_00650 [Nitrososphaerota archaeon]|nr:hypothetical protein [Nitrososphaerota archaeon]
MKLCIAYWPSQWQAATSEETVVDMIFGVFSSRTKAEEKVKDSMTLSEWETYRDQFAFEDLELDQYHPIPHI